MNQQGMTLDQLFGNWDLFGGTMISATLAGAVLGALGVYVVVRRMIFVSAALSQAAGLGVVLAHWLALLGLIALPPSSGAVAMTLAASLLFLGERDEASSRSDSLLGWLYLVGAAGILVVGSRIVQELPDIKSVLFGTAVAVTPDDASRIAWLAALLLVLHGIGARGFIEVSLDRTGALVRGLPVRTLEALLLVSLALAISLTTRILGALPVFAFSVLPAMAALRVSTNIPRGLLLAGALGGLAGFWGYVLASVFGLPVGATQALVAAAVVPAAELTASVATRLGAFRRREVAFGSLTVVTAAVAAIYTVIQVGGSPSPYSHETGPRSAREQVTAVTHHDGVASPPAGEGATHPWSEDLALRDELYSLVEGGLEDHCGLVPEVNAWYADHEARIKELCTLMGDLPLDDPQRWMAPSVEHARALGKEVRNRVWDLHHQLHETTQGCEHLGPLEELVHRYDKLCGL